MSLAPPLPAARPVAPAPGPSSLRAALGGLALVLALTGCSAEVEQATAPTAAPGAPAQTAAPGGDQAGVSGAPRHTETPSADPGTATTAPELADIASDPVHLTITRDGEQIVDGAIEPTTLNAQAELNPPPGIVGWYGPPDWGTAPGELSDHPGVLAAHSTYDGAPDLFFRLGEVRAGDQVLIRYAEGEEATFEADMDALSVPKNDITDKADTDYAWVWSLEEPGRRLSLFSCDPAEGRDLTGHSLNNWVVQATRTS